MVGCQITISLLLVPRFDFDCKYLRIILHIGVNTIDPIYTSLSVGKNREGFPITSFIKFTSHTIIVEFSNRHAAKMGYLLLVFSPRHETVQALEVFEELQVLWSSPSKNSTYEQSNEEYWLLKRVKINSSCWYDCGSAASNLSHGCQAMVTKNEVEKEKL